MKHTLFVGVVLLLSSVAANAQAHGTMYVVPVENGAPNLDKKTATPAEGMAIGSEGFIFYAEGVNASGETVGTYYSVSSRANKPAGEAANFGFNNPLSLVADSQVGQKYINVGEGTYDIEFGAEGTNRYFSIIRTDDPNYRVYPPELYLMTGDDNSAYITVPGTDGEYEMTLELPAGFRIAYQKMYNVAAYILAPSDGNYELTNKVETPLTEASETPDMFVYSSADNRLRSGSKALIHISLHPENEGVTVSRTGTTSIDDSVAESVSHASYYDMGGRMLAGEPTAPGLYIRKIDGHAEKIALR